MFYTNSNNGCKFTVVMERRDYIKSAIGSIVLPITLAGCSATDLVGGLEVTGIDSTSTSFGNVIITARVENTSTEPVSGELVGQVKLDTNTYTESRNITVSPQESSSYQLEFDINLRDSLSGSQYTTEAWIN